MSFFHKLYLHTTKTMYLFIYPAKDLRDDLEVLKSKSHDISEEKNLAQKIVKKFVSGFMVIKSNLKLEI